VVPPYVAFWNNVAAKETSSTALALRIAVLKVSRLGILLPSGLQFRSTYSTEQLVCCRTSERAWIFFSAIITSCVERTAERWSLPTSLYLITLLLKALRYVAALYRFYKMVR